MGLSFYSQLLATESDGSFLLSALPVVYSEAALPVCLSSKSSVTRLMTSGCSRQSNRSSVVIAARLDSCDIPSAPSHSLLRVELGLQSGAAWLTADFGSSAQFLWDLTSGSFVVTELVEFFCWQRTGKRFGPKGTLKGEPSVDGLLFLLICPVESRFTGVSLRSSLRLMWQRFARLWAQAWTARFTYCMFSLWDVTLSCKNTWTQSSLSSSWQSTHNLVLTSFWG